MFWGVGSGWAAAGMTRVIRALPDAMQPEKACIAVLSAKFRTAAEGQAFFLLMEAAARDILETQEA